MVEGAQRAFGARPSEKTSVRLARTLRRGGRVVEGAQRAFGARPSEKTSVRLARTLRRGGRVVEGARLESVYTGNRIAGSNPAPSAISIQTRSLMLFALCGGKLNAHAQNDRGR